jgi:hypothetical protein
MLELDEFIAEAMTSIVRGIQKGQDSDVGDHIAPLLQGKQRNAFGNFHLKDDDTNQATIVQFDVQVGTETRKEGDGGGQGKVRLYVVDVELGSKVKLASETSNLHRLQFSIPVKIPVKSKGTSQHASD